MLEWARTSANLSPLAAARKLKLPDDRVEQWERGAVKPTIAQLRAASRVYKRSLAVFFLSEPPAGFETLRDFRRLAVASEGGWSAALHAEYRRAHAQRDVLLELAELEDEFLETSWRIALPTNDDDVALNVRKHLRELAAMPYPTPVADEYEHLNFWTNALEEAGVLVMSTEGGEVEVEEMRAFSLYFDEAPVIMLNGADAARGRLFSMLHEYVHLLMHTEGLCDTTTDMRATTPDRALEARCNAVAAAILMPSSAVLASRLVAEHGPGDTWTLSDLIEAAKPFGVSVESFLRRLVTLGRVALNTYQEFRGEQQNQRDKRKPRGGNFYLTKARDLGKGYVRRVSSAHRRATIDSTTAATYLDVKVDQMPELIRAARVRS
jgi:Zn-dependent peptidase ImmA (M78 family)